MQYILGFLLVLASTHMAGDYMHYQWYMLFLVLSACLFVSGVITIRDKRRIRGVAIMGISYLLMNSAYVALFRQNRYSFNPSNTKALLAYFASDQALCALLLMVFFYVVKDARSSLKALGVWCLANSIYTVHGWIEGTGVLHFGIGYSGFLNYASANGIMIAATIPFLPTPKKWKYFFHVLAILAALMSKSSVPIGGLLIAYGTMAAMHFITRKNAAMVVGFMLTCVVSLLAIAQYFDRALFDDGYRFQAYKVFLTYWWKVANVFTGFGPGTHWPLASTIQSESGFMVGRPGENSFVWLQAHNEWLQVLTEHGAVGFLFATTLFVMCVYTFIKKRASKELAATLTLAACSLLNFPLRYAIGAFMVGALLLRAINLEESHEVLDI